MNTYFFALTIVGAAIVSPLLFGHGRDSARDGVERPSTEHCIWIPVSGSAITAVVVYRDLLQARLQNLKSTLGRWPLGPEPTLTDWDRLVVRIHGFVDNLRWHVWGLVVLVLLLILGDLTLPAPAWVNVLGTVLFTAAIMALILIGSLWLATRPTPEMKTWIEWKEEYTERRQVIMVRNQVSAELLRVRHIWADLEHAFQRSVAVR